MIQTVKPIFQTSPLALIIAMSLSGCGGEGGNQQQLSSTGSSSSTELTTYSAQDATFSTDFVETYEVDLSSKVFSSNGNGFAVTRVESLNDSDRCHVEEITETGFIVQASDPKVCNYRYYVGPKTVEGDVQKQSFQTIGEAGTIAQAITRVAVSAEPTQTELMPISQVTLVDTAITVDLVAELAKVGYTLNTGFKLTDITLPYGNSSSAAAGATEHSIDFTPAVGFTGIERVLYTLEDDANGEVLMGVLDVAIGFEANKGFSIDQDAVYKDELNVNQLIEIDISEFVNSVDDDEYQLVYIESFNATVNAKDPLDINNKIITFETAKADYHYISFAVSDHNGAYDMGLIRVKVIDPNQSAKWDDIPHDLNLYTAPPTAVDAVTEGVDYDMKLSDTAYVPAIDMAGYRYQSAVAYCDKMGADLPTVTQLTQMTDEISTQASHNWPVQSTYLAFDEMTEEPKWVDLADGATQLTGPVDPVGAYYVTCLKQSVIDVLPTSSTQVVANGVDVGSVFVALKLADEVRPDKLVTASVSNPNGEPNLNVMLDSNAITTDSDGIAEFRLTSFKAETVILTLDVDGVIEKYEVKFIGDEKTAAVTSEATINNSTYASDGNQVTATLKDQNDNPVEGYTVGSTVNSQAHPNTGDMITPIIKPEKTETDEFGEQKFRVKWDSQFKTPTQNMTFDVTSSYITTTGNPSEHVSEVTFIAYLCGGQVGDDDKGNAAGDCIKMVESGGKLYTGNPSTSFLQAIDYDVYGSTYSENGDNGPVGTFARFSNSEGDSLCTYYNTIKLFGKSDWRLTTKVELHSLFDDYGNMFSAKGWATDSYYWSSTANGSRYYNVSLDHGSVFSLGPSNHRYASCVAGS